MLLHGPATGRHSTGVLIQREAAAHADAVRAVTDAAFGPDGERRPTAEALLVDELRTGPDWLPALSLVAVHPAAGGTGTEVVGHVVCSRGWVADLPALGLGPLSVHPDHQRRGVGSALVHAVLGAADALDEPLVALLGSPVYYARFGFRLAEEYGITPPVAGWRPHFQVRTLSAYTPQLHGAFRYAAPFDRF